MHLELFWRYELGPGSVEVCTFILDPPGSVELCTSSSLMDSPRSVEVLIDPAS